MNPRTSTDFGEYFFHAPVHSYGNALRTLKTLLKETNTLIINPMKKFNIHFSVQAVIISMMAMFIFPLLVSAQSKTNFSGIWALNESKSKFGDEGMRGGASQLQVTQADNSMTIVRTSQSQSGDNMTRTEKLTLDGKEADNSSDNRTSKSKAMWDSDGKNLNIDSHMEFERNGNTMSVDITEVWKLQDPNTLEIDYTSKSSRGERQRTYVYDKK